MTVRHNLYQDLHDAKFPATGSIMNTPSGWLFGWGTTPGNGHEGWATGALYTDFDESADEQNWINEGDSDSASWEEMGELA